MKRRSFLLGAIAAPAVIVTPGLLMPVRVLTPETNMVSFTVSGIPQGSTVWVGLEDGTTLFTQMDTIYDEISIPGLPEGPAKVRVRSPKEYNQVAFEMATNMENGPTKMQLPKLVDRSYNDINYDSIYG